MLMMQKMVKKKMPIPSTPKEPVKPIKTLKRWVGNHKSPLLWHDPQLGDYGYFTSYKQHMFFDGAQWLPVGDFLGMHNKMQLNLAAAIDAKETKPLFKVYGNVKTLEELKLIKNPAFGESYMCLDNGNIYAWEGADWLPIQGADANFEALIAEATAKKHAKVKSEVPPKSDEVFPRKRIIKRTKPE